MYSSERNVFFASTYGVKVESKTGVLMMLALEASAGFVQCFFVLWGCFAATKAMTTWYLVSHLRARDIYSGTNTSS